jgi:hypothetical protein
MMPSAVIAGFGAARRPGMTWVLLLVGLTIGGAAVSSPAGAVDVAALYQAYWAGLPAGEIRLALHDGATAYRDRIEIRTEGLSHLFTRFRGVAVCDGRLGATMMPAPEHYDASYALRKNRDKRLVMRFETRAAAAVVLADRGPGDTSKKPPLPARFRTNVLDPLSALRAIRDAVRRGQRGPFAVPVYDGERRFDVIARALPKMPGDKDLRLQLTLSPIAGFKGESSDDGDPEDAPRPASLTLSDDERLMPLAFRVSLADLPLVIELRSLCGGAAACRW